MHNDPANQRIAVVIAAGGVGSRFAASASQKRHKQCLVLAGHPIYMWSLAAFSANRRIKEIVVVAHKDVIGEIAEQIAEHARQKIERNDRDLGPDIDVIEGGESRQQSVFIGLKHLEKSNQRPSHVLIHDAARPFVTRAIIDATIDSVIEYGACSVAVPVSDTIKRTEGDTILETIDRANLYAVQTPQAGRLDWLLEGHRDAHDKAIAATDDSFILERMNRRVKVVAGDRFNIKVTLPEDMLICEAISNMFISQIMDT